METNNTPKEIADDPIYQALSKDPVKWLERRFPKVAEKYRIPLDIISKDTCRVVRNIDEDFFAAALGELGDPDSPTVYVDGVFYKYEKTVGIYNKYREESLITDLSSVLHQCADECDLKGYFDVRALRYSLSKATTLAGVIKKAKGILDKGSGFFNRNQHNLIPCNNGILDVSKKILLPFSPDYRFRDKISVEYNPAATCPLFLDCLMKMSLEPEDIETIREWCYLVFIGKNISQVILILFGTAGAGKTTFQKVIVGIVGDKYCYTLRPQLLGDKHETSFYIGKRLLYSPDVSSVIIWDFPFGLLFTTGVDSFL